jgi:hypothetical protein
MNNYPHEEMQVHQGSPLGISVTDVDAESMICCNGSVDGYVQVLSSADAKSVLTRRQVCSRHDPSWLYKQLYCTRPRAAAENLVVHRVSI